MYKSHEILENCLKSEESSETQENFASPNCGTLSFIQEHCLLCLPIVNCAYPFSGFIFNENVVIFPP